MFVPVFGRWAVALFALCLGIGCLGAAAEIALNGGYVLAQSFGWTWGADKPRKENGAVLRSRFRSMLVLAHAAGAARHRSAAGDR